MGVPMKTAVEWELEQKYGIPQLPQALKVCVTWYFANARIKDWNAKLREYWDPNEDEVRNVEQCRDYMQRNPTAEHQLRRTIETCKQMRRDEFYGFMHLPSEIRNIIYGYVLRKGRVIVPNEMDGRRGTKNPVEYYEANSGYCYGRYDELIQEIIEMNEDYPAQAPLGLLQGVSRSVHDEAARVYFGENQFIFPAGYFIRPLYCNTRLGISTLAYGYTIEQAFSQDFRNRINNAPLLRDVSYTFDMRDCETDDRSNLFQSRHKDDIDSGTIDPLQALQWLHDEKKYWPEIEWAERIDSIKRMTLDRLVLDFQECYCAMGCCRKVQWVVDRFLHEGPPPGTADTEDNAFSSIDWVSRPPLVVEVMGFVNDGEEARALKELERLPGSKVRLTKIYEGPDFNELMMQELSLDDYEVEMTESSTDD